jgi:D-alanine transaminase
MIVFFNGQFLDKANVAISPDDRGFLLADGVYDVIRSYRGHLFQCEQHIQRLAAGLEALRIQGCDCAALPSIAGRLLQQNRLQDVDATIYMQVTRGVAPRTHRFPPAGTPPTVYVEPKPFTPPLEARQKGMPAALQPDERWGRCDIKTIGLLANTLANQKGFESGAFETILCRDGKLYEGTHSSIVFVKGRTLICPPLDHRILPGVTRAVVLSLATAQDLSVEIRSCLVEELREFDEVLMLGTTAEIVPLTSVDGQKIGCGTPGPVAAILQAAFGELVKSLVEPQKVCA